MNFRSITRATRLARTLSITVRLAGTLALQASLFGSLHAQTFVWLEGETPTSANVQGNPHGWGNKHFMSGGAWLHFAIEADRVMATVPEEGVLLKYDFESPAAGEYEAWARIGLEFIRAPFDWRVDNNEWKRVSPEELTTDLMEIAMWCELAWIQLGKVQLDAGPHALEIRLPRIVGADDKPQRIIFSLDCACFSLEPFFPYSHWKPGEDWRTDKDRAAAEHVFKIPETPAGQRAVVPLNGAWEVTRNDEQTPPADVAQPMMDFPAETRWTAIDVPSNRNTSRPDLVFSHRLWYRTRVDVPESMAGRGFALRFPQNNLNTTVFVNGEYCGFFAYPFADFNIDISAAVKPGVNEVWVGIRDAWYGFSTNPNDPLKLRKKFNAPVSLIGEGHGSGQGWQDLAWPVWSYGFSGILQTPELIAMGGPVYTSDVFMKPSVARKELAVETTLLNPTKEAVNAVVTLEAVNTKSGEVEKKFAPVNVALAAGEEKMVEITEPWADPKLWWPDEPNLYWLRATVVGRGVPSAPPLASENGSSEHPAGMGLPALPWSDTSSTRFGFREWDWSTKDFKLNGVPWRGWSDHGGGSTKEDWLAYYRKTNQTAYRFWGTSWMGLAPREAYDFWDENGIVVRRSGLLDGERIGYFAIERDPDLKALYGSEIKMDLLDNWRETTKAQVRGDRNHPSAFMWAIENEFLFINCINLYGNLMDQFEAEITKAANAIMAVDPTRPVMVDGGGACKDNSLPVHGDHYITAAPHAYPPFAYTVNTRGGGRGRWEWDQQRPRFMGEDFYMTGNHPEASYFQGDSAFAGKPVAGVGLWNRMLQEGYRWVGFGGWDFALSNRDHGGILYPAFAARAVFSKEWNWTFAPGAEITRTFGVFNDTHHADPITFTWTLNVDGKAAVSKSRALNVAPGTHEVVEETLVLPQTATPRQEAELVLTLAVNGKEVFTDTKHVTLLAPQKRELPDTAQNDLVVFDPEGAVTAFLKAQNIGCAVVASLDELPQDWKILLIGGNALDPAEGASSRLAAFAATGRRVIVLDQDHPLRHQGMPAEMAFSGGQGFTAFIEDTSHPVFANLADKDFFAWTAFDTPVYRNVYDKPARGARSLMQCHNNLRHTALAEIPVGTGLILACQVNVTAGFAENPVARQLVLNLLGHAAAYKLEFAPVFACVDGA
ncbi:MAG: hypothetical protein FWF96_01175, partial [Kiritimatiellaeota bacterium]|nr:hypothetical protein [Kiritimatiellota bacterium]